MSALKPAKHPKFWNEQIIKFSGPFRVTTPVRSDGHSTYSCLILLMLTYPECKVNNSDMRICSAGGCGGQSIFSDINIYWNARHFFTGVPAMGPQRIHRQELRRLQQESQNFAMALMDVYFEGTPAEGRSSTKPQVHITNACSKHPVMRVQGKIANLPQRWVLCISCLPEETLHAHIRMLQTFSTWTTAIWKTQRHRLEDALLRYTECNNQSFRIAYMSSGSDEGALQNLRGDSGTCAKAHGQKKVFIQGFLSLGNNDSSSLLTMDLTASLTTE